MIQQTKNEITTAEQLSAMADDGHRYELINGVLRMMSPAGSEHGQVADRISRRLGNHVESKNLGATYAAETGFLIRTSPDTVRAPRRRICKSLAFEICRTDSRIFAIGTRPRG